MEHVWDHAFYNELKINPSDCKILLTDPPLNPSKNREKMIETMFEKYNFAGVFIQIQAVLTLYAQVLILYIEVHAGESEKVLRKLSPRLLLFQTTSHLLFLSMKLTFFVLGGVEESKMLVIAKSSLHSWTRTSLHHLHSPPRVVVVASTNRVDAIDPALRRAGRFDTLVEVSTPNEEDRFKILLLYTKKVNLDASVDLQAIATSCNGYVGADLEALCREATISASKRSVDSLILTLQDFKIAKSVVGPSITRGIAVEIPKVTWDDVGGLKDLKKKFQQAVEWPIKHSAAFTRMGISPMRGILLHGPPGCSKTTLAKAAANAAQASFFSLSCAELFSMYVGEGEALLRNTFQRARLAAPCIIFFDEADVVACKRGEEKPKWMVLKKLRESSSWLPRTARMQ
ncbi:hypothetical protein Bca52824_068643 [Brassica carinata]|uniref:AAA+ ATPase domain-containing protein n=1 Tax=Brassica carinata TaxID=52824 RepID=A0A8X7Q5R8_BRACI|nr:hypothetical protein Bca52824_068643 [Brassica carinata]